MIRGAAKGKNGKTAVLLIFWWLYKQTLLFQKPLHYSGSCLTKTYMVAPLTALIRSARSGSSNQTTSSSINYSLSVQNIGGQRVGDDQGGNSGTKNQFFLPPDSNDMTRKACKSFLLSRGMANLCSATIHYFTAIYPSSSLLHTTPTHVHKVGNVSGCHRKSPKRSHMDTSTYISLAETGFESWYFICSLAPQATQILGRQLVHAIWILCLLRFLPLRIINLLLAGSCITIYLSFTRGASRIMNDGTIIKNL